ncbi:putative dithiol-disulfide isomerase [Ameyamaea chiangmaiensis NBRC 103196]|uniref:DsbA family protein n=1 Tax=Ameyamaea chiangmaiensis TaxID=442969 RepID=A0A850P7R5_9PROT|nr:DsbA family protein [Ameyamaea chiangmaiensis]MBS4073760.1 DsbA family protein [Ameyamaea chiangmaiensis]NVN39974.1 DsbA family protein [Ameyamaea chiangmaiensis]GBQ68556.1 putative dithiol-disulfide isomerase [Ameyamaea chiangmaiensis NBRC 103196]
MNMVASVRPPAGQATAYVENFFDLTCPWSFLGSARLMRVLATIEAEKPEAAGRLYPLWRPFLLDPFLPPHGLTRAGYSIRKFGSESRARRFYLFFAELSRAEGLTIEFESMVRIPSTMNAHRVLIWLRNAAPPSRLSALAMRLFTAHFADGLDIGDPSVLATLAGELALAPPGETLAMLESDACLGEVMGDHGLAQRRGLPGAPCLVAGGMAIAGLQDETVLGTLVRLSLMEGAGPARQG